MIPILEANKIYLYSEFVDFRKGLESLAAYCRNHLKQDPMQGGVFVFINRKKTSIKILTYDGQGFWIAQKRLSQGRFMHWPAHGHHQLLLSQLQAVLWNGNPFDFKKDLYFTLV